jgi:tetratricopeptide (TPR) repeat protein
MITVEINVSPRSLGFGTRLLCLSTFAVLAGCQHVVTVKEQSSGSSAAHAYGSASTQDVSLSTIINRDLQNGRYADGERELRHYLQKHPSDRVAKSLMQQLNANPADMLGPVAQRHVVQAGESYSTLAAKYLGDANLFLILARYNNAANPSLLAVGTSIQLPQQSSRPANFSGTEGSTLTTPNTTATATAGVAANESPAQRAFSLQEQGVVQYQQGHQRQALSLIDQALALDPSLKSSGSAADSLRNDWVSDCHQRAIVLYRDQHLDEAIALWNRVLAVDPGFEPAVIYRARALELKQRLKQF